VTETNTTLKFLYFEVMSRFIVIPVRLYNDIFLISLCHLQNTWQFMPVVVTEYHLSGFSGIVFSSHFLVPCFIKLSAEAIRSSASVTVDA
jgi:hypothetical protein